MSRLAPSSAPDLLAGLVDEACDRRIEEDFAQRWGGPVAGVDEVGRGPLAGPVVTAAVILTDAPLPDGLTDSKQLRPSARVEMFEAICRDHIVAVASASAARIDAMNILAANLWAMGRAVRSLAEQPVGVLVDGRDVPAGLMAAGYRGMAIVRGDARVAAIAAASVVAKVMRDRMMELHAAEFPGYGFETNVGYGSAKHLRALTELGPTPIHRRSFRPVRDCIEARAGCRQP
ncbi:ribonuclease HII [Pleomorphomonas carboxyditropha]|uniref:Ribonuclease HII n=1 Tax=Pleomorphomonas carboxyditropha TaxID=2023338 RepID=A0A2G9WXC2_9HYPH|nr:ribonuclease HII [Pleomorphomonas carboxyditropha]PIO98770.1 ribonuclease HII [Pleomorphomonas carboxyditropha]